MSEPVIRIEELRKVFRDFWRRPRVTAVDGINLSVAPGSVFGLLGPNGSGKSTTIKMLLGLLRPTSGTIEVLGCPPGSLDSCRRLGYLPEDTYLHRFLSPRETLHLYCRLFNMDKSTRKLRVDQLLAMLELERVANRQIGEFSKGMARRVGLAQALVNDPDLLILDEPTSGLDPIGCRQVKDLIRALARRGKTVLLTSHLLADVENVCDHIAIMYRGALRAHGTTEQLLQRDDAWNIRIPTVKPEQLQKLLTELREAVGAEVDACHPAVDLESLFLDVIARADGHEGTGEEASREPVAEFLRPGQYTTQPKTEV